MKEWGLYSANTGGLIIGLGLCEDEDEAMDTALYYIEREGWDSVDDAYVAERCGV